MSSSRLAIGLIFVAFLLSPGCDCPRPEKSQEEQKQEEKDARRKEDRKRLDRAQGEAEKSKETLRGK